MQLNNEVNIEELLPIVSAKNKNFPVKNKVNEEFEEKLKEKLEQHKLKNLRKRRKQLK